MGEVFRVHFKRADKDDKLKTSLILKKAQQNLRRRERYNIRSLYLGEIRMYDEVGFSLPGLVC